MTKEECLKAKEILRMANDYPTSKYNNSDLIDQAIQLFENLVEEHFNNPPLRYEEIEEEKWYWHNKKKEWIKIISKDLCVPSEYPIIETIYEYIEFESNCFYRKQVEE